MIHSFWAPKLGVKADANPGVDNIAFTKPTNEQAFEIHCSELCGLWHGYMFDTGQVVSDASVLAWIHHQARSSRPPTRTFPSMRRTTSPNLEEGRMSNDVAVQAALAALDRFQPSQRDRAGVVGFYFGWWLGHQVHAESLNYFEDTNQNESR